MTSAELIALGVQFLSGLIGVGLTQWLKAKFDVEGTTALLIAAIVSALLAIGALFLSGEITLTVFTWENLPNAFGIVFSAATLAYKLLMPKE